MKRRSKTSMTTIHVSIPVKLKEDFDNELDFNQSRSHEICEMIKAALSFGAIPLHKASVAQLVHMLIKHDVINPTLEHLLLQVLSE
jgi:metal-responsive CopG/Arc/MetJ family transcriptional regulator